jgi:putative transposase
VPRANRYYLPGHVWHLTHRCHDRAHLLKAARDRERWLHWLYEARRRFGLCVLDYNATRNHVHLVVESGERRDTIPRSMQLAAGQTAEEYNARKGRSGAFWDDRYHATAVESGRHLLACLTYIDLNMVRAGVVKHPREWPHAGYHELVRPRRRYQLVSHERLIALLGFGSLAELQEVHQQRIGEALAVPPQRNAIWTESVAVGSSRYLSRVNEELGWRAAGREVVGADVGSELFVLREHCQPYEAGFGPENDPMGPKNMLRWNPTDQ